MWLVDWLVMSNCGRFIADNIWQKMRVANELVWIEQNMN